MADTARPLSAGAGAVLSFAVCVGLFAPGAVGALSPFLISELAIARTAVGALGTLAFAVAAALSPVAGGMVDRHGGRTMMVALFAAGAAGWGLFGLAQTYALLVLGVAVAGVAMAFANTATTSVITQHAPAGTVARFVGVAQTGPPVAALIAGFLLPAGAVVMGWRATLLIFAALSAAAVLVTLRVIPPNSGAAGSAASPADTPGTPLIASRPWSLALYALLINLAIVPVIVYVPLYAFERLDWSAPQAAVLTGVHGFASLLGRLAWASGAPGAAQVRRRLIVLPLVAALAMLAIVSAAPLSNSGVLLVGVAIFGGSAMAWTVLTMLSVALDSGGAARRTGRHAGTVMLLGFVGGAVGPLLFGAVVDTTDAYSPAWGIALMALLATSGLAALRARRARAVAG